jgi:hypothetical protein
VQFGNTHAQQVSYQQPAKTPVSQTDAWQNGITDKRMIEDIEDYASDPQYNRNTFKAFLQSPAGYSDLTDDQITNVLDHFFPAGQTEAGGSTAEPAKPISDIEISEKLREVGININVSAQPVTVRDNLRIIVSDPDLLQKFAELNKNIGSETLLKSLTVPKSAEELKTLFTISAHDIHEQQTEEDIQKWQKLPVEIRQQKAEELIHSLRGQGKSDEQIKDFLLRELNQLNSESALGEANAICIEQYLTVLAKLEGQSEDQTIQVINNYWSIRNEAVSSLENQYQLTIFSKLLGAQDKSVISAMVIELGKSRDKSESLNITVVLAGICKMSCDGLDAVEQEIIRAIFANNPELGKIYGGENFDLFLKVLEEFAGNPNAIEYFSHVYFGVDVDPERLEELKKSLPEKTQNRILQLSNDLNKKKGAALEEARVVAERNGDSRALNIYQSITDREQSATDNLANALEAVKFGSEEVRNEVVGSLRNIAAQLRDLSAAIGRVLEKPVSAPGLNPATPTSPNAINPGVLSSTVPPPLLELVHLLAA